MADDHARSILRQYEDLRTQRALYEPEWRDQIEFLAPNMRRLMDFVTPGTRNTGRLYDTTGPNDARKLANYLNGVVSSASTRFQTLVTRDPALMRSRAVTVWLDEASDRLFSAYQQSNFKGAFAQGYGSLVRHGTTAIYVEERERERPGFNGFRYFTFPVGRWVVSRNADSQVDVFMHEFELTAKAAEAKFGRAALPERVRRVLERNPYERAVYIHALYPRAGTKGRWPIEACYLAKEDVQTVQETGYHEMPVFVADWERDEGELYGKGPGHLALPDVRSLNRCKQLGLEALALQVRPPLQVPHDGVLGGQVRLTPAAQNVLLTDRDVKAIDLGHDLQSEMVKSEDLRNAIRSVFYRDLVALPDKNYMTATEIVKQLELVNREIGPTLGNIEDGLLKPHAERTFALLWRARAFPPPPPELAGAALDIEFEGPLARAQRAGDLQAYQAALALVQAYTEQDEDAGDLLDTDENVRYIWSVSGSPARLLRSAAAVRQIREARAQSAQQAAQAAQAKEEMTAIEGGARTFKAMAETVAQQGTA